MANHFSFFIACCNTSQRKANSGGHLLHCIMLSVPRLEPFFHANYFGTLELFINLDSVFPWRFPGDRGYRKRDEGAAKEMDILYRRRLGREGIAGRGHER